MRNFYKLEFSTQYAYFINFLKLEKDIENHINDIKNNVINSKDLCFKIENLMNESREYLGNITLYGEPDFIEKNGNMYIKINKKENSHLKNINDMLLDVNELEKNHCSLTFIKKDYFKENCFVICVDCKTTKGKHDEILQPYKLYQMSNIRIASDGNGRTANISGMKYRYRLKRFRVVDVGIFNNLLDFDENKIINTNYMD